MNFQPVYYVHHVNSMVHRLKSTKKFAVSEEEEFLTNFSQNCIFQKLTTDFKNCTKHQAEMKDYALFWTLTTRPYLTE